MKTWSVVIALILAGIGTAFSNPGDPVNPAKLRDKVSFSPGAKGGILFKRDGNNLGEPKWTIAIDEKAPGIAVDFKAAGEVQGQTMLLLMVRNHFDKTLRYRAAMKVKGRGGFVETSLVPIMPGLASGESWVDPIEELILFDFKLTDEKF